MSLQIVQYAPNTCGTWVFSSPTNLIERYRLIPICTHSPHKSPHSLGPRSATREPGLGSIGNLADGIGISGERIVEIEKSKSHAEVGLVLRALNAPGITFDARLENRATG